MAFTFDESTYKISLPQGDTADIDVSIDYAGIEPGDALLFAIFDPQSGDLMSKAVNQNFVPVVDDKDIFIGIITRKDIIQYLDRQVKQAEQAV